MVWFWWIALATGGWLGKCIPQRSQRTCFKGPIPWKQRMRDDVKRFCKQLRTVLLIFSLAHLIWIGTCRWWTVCASDLQDFMSQCQLQCCVQEAFSRFAAVAPGLYDLQTTSKRNYVECHRSTEWQRGKKHLLHDQTRDSTDSSAIFKQILRSKTVPIWCAVLQAVIQKQEAYGIRYAKIWK